MAVTVNYRFLRPVTPGLAQSGEVFADQGEEVPYPMGYVSTPSLGAWPPPGFELQQEDEDTVASSVNDQTPTTYDHVFVQGDTLTDTYDFYDVLWTPEDPEIADEGAPEWVKVEWGAQIRNPYLTASYAVDRWVPMNGTQYVWWRSNSWIADIDVTAEAIEVPDSDPQQWATRVSIRLPADRSRAILPGNQYRWDLQTRVPNEDEEDKADDDVYTWLSGRVRVLTQWTTS